MPMTKRDAERLARKCGAHLVRNGGSHDIWVTANGQEFAIPRHPGDLKPGVERDIKRKLGVG